MILQTITLYTIISSLSILFLRDAQLSHGTLELRAGEVIGVDDPAESQMLEGFPLPIRERCEVLCPVRPRDVIRADEPRLILRLGRLRLHIPYDLITPDPVL